MKKLLVCFFLLFASAFSAQALEKNDLIGYWEAAEMTDGFAGAFYLHVDGTCTVFPEESGEWTFADDMLQLTCGGKTVRYAMQYTAAEENDAYYLDMMHLQADGRAVDFLRRDVPEEDTLRKAVPQAIQKMNQANHGPFDTLEGYLEITGAPDGEHAFLLIVDDEIRMLRAFRYADGAWEQWLNSSAVVPQGKEKATLYTRGKGAEYQYNWDWNTTYVSDGLHIGICTSNGEMTMEGVSFVWQKDGFHLHGYQFEPGNYVDVVNGEMVFWNISNGDERFVKATIATDIREIAFYALPAKPENVAQNADQAPVVSEVKYLNRAFKLSPQEAVFKKNQRCNVYMGPGKSYGRAGNGKALVSTNDWIQVFAKYDGWLLIQYSINDTRYRIGWIEDDAVVSKEDIPRLPMQIYDVGTLLTDAELTDDPLGSKTKVRSVKKGTKVDIMAQLDDAWLYVQYMQEGKTYYGFLPVSVMMFDSNG